MKNILKLWVTGLVLIPAVALAYGPQSVITSTGQPVKWTLPIAYDIESDLDVRGKSVSTLLDDAVAEWTAITESSILITKGSLGVSIDNDNVCCYLYDSAACPSASLTDGINPIVVDDDGSIVARFFGTANRFVVLGFAAIISYDSATGVAAKGEAVFNAACLNTVEITGCGSLSFSDDDFTSFIVHETGHFLGLNHTQVNDDAANDSDTSNDDLITTMYPIFTVGNGTNFKSPERDDKVGLAFLYPASDFASTTGKLSGTVKNSSGTQYQCANMIARNTTSSLSKTDAISFISGALSAGGTADGTYEILGLTAGQSYSVEAEPINANFTSSSGLPPCDGSGSNPGPSSKQFTDQTSGTTVSATAGSSATGVDFTLAGTSSLRLPTLEVGNVEQAPEQDEEIPDLDAESQQVIAADIAALELRSKNASSCSSSTVGTVTTGSSASSGGCSLIPGF